MSPASIGPEAPEIRLAGPLEPGRLRRWACAVWHLVAGATLCQGPLGALLVVGWSQRATRRAILRVWWKRRGGGRPSLTFEAFCAEDLETLDSAHWPSWVLGRPADEARGWRRIATRLAGSFWANLRTGLANALCTFTLIGPAGLLWAGAWYAGWQNSFNKGYENAAIGPAVFLVGMLWFAVAMLHVPMAWARQASTGRWGSFFDFRLVWSLVRRRWAASFGLALLAAGLSAAALVVKTMPVFFPQMAEARIRKEQEAGRAVPEALVRAADPTPAEALKRIHAYFWYAALFQFPAFALLRIAAGRVYAGALLDAVRAGACTGDDLDEREWHALRRLDLITPEARPVRGRFVRLAAWLATRAGRTSAVVATMLVWLGLAGLVVVSEFLRYSGGGGGTPGRGWWNQPMLQVPWFNYTPAQLEKAAKEDSGANGSR